jgi:hypothetical protein
MDFEKIFNKASAKTGGGYKVEYFNRKFLNFREIINEMGLDILKEARESNCNRGCVSGCFSAKDIRAKLLEINPQIIEDSEYTNPFLYRDTKEWYDELGK